MVIVRLIGGLGNQLFQYALGRRIAYLHQVPLKLDVADLSAHKLRAYNLQPFNIVEAFATPREVAELRRVGDKKIRLRVLARFQRLLPYHRRTYIVERQFHFDPEILKASGNVYLEGYWQSEKYFKDVESLIRDEFTVKTAPDAVNAAMAKKIEQVHAVSVHIRRGDYATDSTTHEVHGMCSLDYYDRAIRNLAEKIEQPCFFVFSDDPEWAIANLQPDYPVIFITHNGADKNYEDLRLMSLCKHHIIANSTFSWWGAWLCTNPDKIVITPQKWFSSSKLDDRDLIPGSWQRI